MGNRESHITEPYETDEDTLATEGAPAEMNEDDLEDDEYEEEDEDEEEWEEEEEDDD